MRRLMPALAAALVCAFALAACGSDDPASQQTPASGTQPAAPRDLGRLSEDQQAQLEDFQACLREQGAELPSGPPAGGPPEMTDELREAFAACRDKLPQGGPGGMPPGGVPGGEAPSSSEDGNQS